MTRAQAGRRGGIATVRKFGIERCPTCHQLVTSGYYQGIGVKGAEVAHRLYSPEQYSEWGKLGGRGNKKGGK